MQTTRVKLNNKIDNGKSEHGESEYSETAKSHTISIVNQCKPQIQTKNNKTDNNKTDGNKTFPDEQKNTEIDILLKTIEDNNKNYNSSQWLTGC